MNRPAKACSMCAKEFAETNLDFLGRCEPCFRLYIQAPLDKPILFQSTRNKHNPKETRAYVERLEKKRMTPDGGVEHNYKKRIYG